MDTLSQATSSGLPRSRSARHSPELHARPLMSRRGARSGAATTAAVAGSALMPISTPSLMPKSKPLTSRFFNDKIEADTSGNYWCKPQKICLGEKCTGTPETHARICRS
jgi:hypothetical protein